MSPLLITGVSGCPDYEFVGIRPKSQPYAVCVFVLNEGEKVRKQLKGMLGLTRFVDIYVCDGGSTDGSLDLPYLEECGVTALLVKKGPGKLGAQMRMGFHHVLEEGYLGVVVIDGNGKDGYSATPAFVDALEAGVDHVQGSRFIPGGHHENTPLSRFLAVRLFHSHLISFAAGFSYTDTTNGFRAYSARFLQDPRLGLFRDVFSGYELHYYLAVKAARLGYRCQEVPVSRVYPKGGKVPTKISPIKGNLGVLSCLYRILAGCYDLPSDLDS